MCGRLLDPDDADGFADALREALAPPEVCSAMAAYNRERVIPLRGRARPAEMAALYRDYMGEM